jgi:hypothetical protein
MEALRALLIWMIQFAIFYGCERSEALREWRLVGEEWTSAAAFQAGGLALKVVGCSCTTRYPCWSYEAEDKATDASMSATPLLQNAVV